MTTIQRIQIAEHWQGRYLATLRYYVDQEAVEFVVVFDDGLSPTRVYRLEHVEEAREVWRQLRRHLARRGYRREVEDRLGRAECDHRNTDLSPDGEWCLCRDCGRNL